MLYFQKGDASVEVGKLSTFKKLTAAKLCKIADILLILL